MSNDGGFNRGFQENTYSGSGLSWTEWQRGQMLRRPSVPSQAPSSCFWVATMPPNH